MRLAVVWLGVLVWAAGAAWAAGARDSRPAGRTAQQPKPPETPEKPPLVMEVRLANERRLNYFKAGAWLELWVYVENNQERVKEEPDKNKLIGLLRTDAFSEPNTKRKISYTRPIVLAPETVKWVRWPIRLPASEGFASYATRALTVFLQPLGHGRPVLSSSLQLTPIRPHQSFIQVVSDSVQAPTAYGYLHRLRCVRGKSDGTTMDPDKQQARVVFTAPSRLARSPLAYESVSHMIWDGADPTQLDPRQKQAIVDWLTWGGALIVCSGPAALGLADTFLGPYLPLVPEGLAELTTCPNLERACARRPGRDLPLTAGEPLGIVAGRLQPGARAIVRDGGHTVLAERDVGAGSVVWVAFSLQHRRLREGDWAGSEALLARCLAHGMRRRAAPDGPAGDRAKKAEEVGAVLRQQSGIAIPSRSFVAGFIMVYLVVLVPVCYLVFRALRRVEWAWAAMPLVTIGFTLAVYQSSAANIGFESVYNEIGVAHAWPEQPGAPGAVQARAHLDRYIGIYSASRNWYAFEFGARTAAAQAMTAEGVLRTEAQDTMNTHFGSRIRLTDFLVQPRSLGLLAEREAVDLGPFTVTRRPGLVEAVNDSPLQFEECVLLTQVGGKPAAHPIGTWAPGQKVRVRLGSPDAVRWSGRLPFARLWPTPRGPGTHEWVGKLVARTDGRPVLLGWRDKPLAPPKLSPEIGRRTGHTLLVLHMTEAP